MGNDQKQDVERLRPLVDKEVLWAYLHGFERFGSSDIVVYLADKAEPRSFLRPLWLEHVARPVPLSVRERLSRPASETEPLEGNQTAFWFVADLPDGDMAAMVIISQRMQDGGDA